MSVIYYAIRIDTTKDAGTVSGFPIDSMLGEIAGLYQHRSQGLFAVKRVVDNKVPEKLQGKFSNYIRKFGQM